MGEDGQLGREGGGSILVKSEIIYLKGLGGEKRYIQQQRKKKFAISD